MRSVLLLVVACALATPMLAVPNHTKWSVRVSSDGFAYFIDQPNCHPLAYFLNITPGLNFHHILVRIEPEKTKNEVKSQRIGEVAGHTIEQITHNVNGGQLFLKMIVVGRGADEFCEIYHQEWMGDKFYQDVLPAYLLKVGSETILATRDPVSGNGNWHDEHYWTFDKDGLIDLCVTEKIEEIQKKLVPDGSSVMNGGGFDVQNLTYLMPVWGPNDGHCCPTGGSIQIKFALNDHHLSVVSQSLDAGT
jgi:hypothetical protein